MKSKKPLWHPTLKQEILIKINLAKDKNEAISYWKQWGSKYKVINLQNESYLLLQSAISNLVRLNTPLPQKIRSISHQTTARNLTAIYLTKHIAKEFSKNKVPLYVLKGLALLIDGTYEQSNMRAMNDMDFYVKSQHYKTALQILLSHGWSVSKSNTNDHSVTLTRPDLPIKLDLHKRPLWFQLAPKIITKIEKDSEIISFKKNSIHVMSPEFQLVHALVHGARGGVNDYSSNTATGTPHLRWIIDAHYLTQNKKINWEQFLNWVKMLEVGIQVRNALELIVNDFKIAVPPFVIAAIENMPKTRTQKLHAYYSMDYIQPTIFKIPRSLRASFHAWLLQNHTPEYINALTPYTYIREFGGFLKVGFSLEKNQSIPAFIIKKILTKPKLLLP